MEYQYIYIEHNMIACFLLLIFTETYCWMLMKHYHYEFRHIQTDLILTLFFIFKTFVLLFRNSYFFFPFFGVVVVVVSNANVDFFFFFFFSFVYFHLVYFLLCYDGWWFCRTLHTNTHIYTQSNLNILFHKIDNNR